jgi:arylsulfatase A-like enzyme
LIPDPLRVAPRPTALRPCAVALVALLACAGLAACEPAPPQPPPNLLLIVVDTLRADHLGCYGAQRDTTPALDALAAGGVRFQRAWSTAPWTKPAVASIFTGLHPSAHGANRVRSSLPESARTLAERLHERGYHTAGVVSHDVLSGKNGFAQGFDRYLEDEAGGHDHVSTRGVTREAMSLLDELASQDAPFFLFVHYFDPHYNYLRHPEFGFAAERAGRLDGSQPLVSLRKLGEGLSDEEVGLLRDLYDEEVRFTDEGIGRVLQHLSDLSLSQRTVVAATADHGEAFLEHGWLGHTRDLYDVLLRVPLIVRAPGIAPRVVEQPVSVVSLLPTLLELLGQPADDSLHGPSLVPLLRGEPLAAQTLYAEVDFLPVFDPAKRAAKRAIVEDGFKLIRDETSGRLELYDLSADPGERHDLAASQPQRVQRMRRRLEQAVADAQRGALPHQDREPSRDELERLRALGYGS